MNHIVELLISQTSNLADIPRSNTAIAEWAAVLVFLTILKPRFSKLKTTGIILAFLIVQIAFLELTGGVAVWLWAPCMVGAFLLMLFMCWSCCDIQLTEALYTSVQAFIMAEFAASLEWQITCFWWDGTGPFYISIWLRSILLVYGGVYFVMRMILKHHIPKGEPLNPTKKELITEIIIAILVFSFSNISYLSLKTPFTQAAAFDIYNARTLVDLGGVATLFAHLVVCGEARIRKELDSVHNMLEMQYQQYKLSRDSIDMVNYKYHDLKHQIQILRNEENSEIRNQYLDQMMSEIKNYELQNKTGNQVLDTVLTGKSIYCNKHGITLTCVADGTLLEFMDTMDLCSVFGNALDNAIEAELQIATKEKRLIHVTVTKQHAFVLIRFENYYESDLRIERGKLLTTKNEKEFHGYGIKSIRYIVAKYEGAINISTENNWFDMKILIPLQEVK